jgi:predicted PurR-regulated permease PerM
LYSKQYNFSIEVPDLSQYTERALSISLSLFSNIFSILTFILLSIYISLDWLNIKKFFYRFLSDGYKSKYEKIINEFEHSIGMWVKGQLILMFVIGFLSTLILYLIGNPYYLPLGILAGILEIVPIVGPIISTLFAVLISFSLNGQTAGLITLGSFYGIQVLENNLLVPKVMEKVSGFSPILILLAFLIFTNFLGVVGAILAVPILMFANILVKYFVTKK